MRTGFDGDGLVDDVAFDAGGRGQADLQATDAADDAAFESVLRSIHAAEREALMPPAERRTPAQREVPGLY